MKRVVLTGPESTGKTTIAKQLSVVFECTLVEEYARTYINQLSKPYCQSDLLQIANGQFNLERNALEKFKFVICDTDLLTIKIWSEYKYGNCDPWIIEQLENNLPHLYLICYPDLEWEFDPQRENPNDGLELFEIYLANIKRLGVPYKIIREAGEKRLETAEKAVREIIF